MIRKFLAPPVFDNEEDNFRARFINGFAWVVILLLALAEIPYVLAPGGDFTVAVLPGLLLVLLGSLYLLKRGRINASGLVIVILGWLAIGFQAFTADGVKDVIIIAYIAVGLLASIVVSHRAGSVVTLSSIAIIALLALRESLGLYQPREQDPIIYGRDLSFIFVSITILIYFSTTALRDAIERAKSSEEKLRASNKSLIELNKTLEERVTNRTSELEAANSRHERRARQFEGISQITRAISANQGFEELINLLVRVITEKFNYYHAGIFLVDENREFAELRAANSEGGKRMLKRSHKLRIGQTGIVGYVAATGDPRIALDVGTDSAYFNNPDLPDTHSEMALPLKGSEGVFGVLDIQSTERNAFTHEDIDVLSVLADQVANAIQNSLYFESTKQIVEDANRTTGLYLRNSWESLHAQKESLGFIAVGNSLRASNNKLDPAVLTKLEREPQVTSKNGDRSSIALPINLGGHVAGLVNIRLQEERDWDADEIDIARAVADRLSLALESAVLLESTQKRAEIERLTSDISGRIGASTQFDSILRTAAEELSRVLGGSEVLVQIQPDDLGSTNTEN